MEKIKAFIKKYWFWIILILLFLLTILVVILLFRGRDEESDIQEVFISIESPYHSVDSNISVELGALEGNFKDKELVMEISKPTSSFLRNFLIDFVSDDIDMDTYESFSYSVGGISVSFNSLISQLIVSKTRGEWLINYPLLSVSDVEIFIKEYFGLGVQNDSVLRLGNKQTLYEGYFQIEEMNVGALALGGYAYKVLVDNSGQLVDLQILVLEEENVKEYQKMPTSPLEILLGIGRYPMSISHTALSKSLHEQPPFIAGTISLEKLLVKEVESLYLFNTFETPYIYPTYKLSGDGTVKDIRGETYWSTTEIYICAIAPEYLYEKEILEPAPSADPFVDPFLSE